MFTNNCVGIRLLLGLVVLFVAVNMNTHLGEADTFVYLPLIVKSYPPMTVHFAQFARYVGYEAYILVVVTPPDDIVRAIAQIEDRQADLSPTECCYKGFCTPAWSSSLCLTGLEPGEKLVTAIAIDKFGNSARAYETLTYTPDPWPPPCFP